ncbi:FAD-dependent oxidoreductase [Spongiactinospora rosea]|uniref:FAD-dependent oxidoreductase n=1 Tax=Spongiactinospora rosea TaxID=2248750 RepID=A0A366LCM7_9ACTN|nr:FAD-dependent monooxygenase [Spongiactinospora rosea]RBQ11657.1 FAD-dependent oxidoreductase [Spongiactinospora rosea]
MRTVICGAGISGLALAHRLAALGGEVVVVERAAGPRPQGYMIDFFGPGLEAVEAMGLLPAFERTAYHYDEGRLVDQKGLRRATIRTKGFSRGRLLNLLRPDIEAALAENLPPEVELRYGTALTEVADRPDGVAVTLEDGTVLDADLLVGADGIHSTVRRLAFGPEHHYLRYLGLHTTAFTFDAPDVHNATRQAFCLTDSVDRQMGFYALRDGRVVLLGDAAHAVSLIAGQGASLGIAGAYLLADRLAHTPTIERATAEFERLWRPVVEDKQRNARSMARWFLPSSPAGLRIRRVMLGLTRVPFVIGYLSSILAGKDTKLADVMRQASGTATKAAAV